MGQIPVTVIGISSKVWPFTGKLIVAPTEGGAVGIVPLKPIEPVCGLVTCANAGIAGFISHIAIIKASANRDNQSRRILTLMA